MGKKSKQKQFRKVNSQNPSSKGNSASLESRPINTNSAAILGTKLSSGGPVKTDLFSDYSYVRRDIRKIVLLIIGLVVILAAAVIVNQKTDLLIDGGNSLSSFLEL